MADRRILIVGGGGYFGAPLAEALSADSQVVVTYRSLKEGRSNWLARTGIDGVMFDPSTSGTIGVAGSFDAIVNLAMPGAVEAARDETVARDRAVRTAETCIALLASGRTKRLIHFSTFHVYGTGNRTSYSETDTPVPATPYARIHRDVENLMLSQRDTVVLRASNMVGRPAHCDLGEQASLFFLDLCRQAAHGVVTMRNDGLSYRDFVTFSDVIDAVRMVLAADPDDRLFNVASGEAVRLDEVAQFIRAVSAAEIRLGSGSDAFRTAFHVQTDRLQQFGWKPRGDLRAVAGEIVKFFQTCP